MTNINDLAKEWLEGLGMDRYVKEQTSETVSRFASYLSAHYTLTPKEEVKVKHACDITNCTGIRFPLLDNKTLCEYEQHIRDTFYKYQPPSNKSTGVKVECKHEWHALPANKGLNDIYCRHCGQER